MPASPQHGLEIRALTAAECRYAAGLHAVCAILPELSVSLGTRYLEAYWQALRHSPHAVALIAVSAQGPLGVAVGVLDAEAHRAWVSRCRKTHLRRVAVTSLLLQPRATVRFARVWLRRAWVRRARRARSHASPMPPAREPGTGAVLLHLFTDPAARQQGVGRSLTDRFVEAVWQSGGQEVSLVTLDGRDGPGAFYARCGWRHAGRYRDDFGRMVAVYRINRRAAAPHGCGSEGGGA